MSHFDCQGPQGHICQEPSGRPCVDCGSPAGTWWGPHWCPDCDQRRLDRCTAQLESIASDLAEEGK